MKNIFYATLFSICFGLGGVFTFAQQEEVAPPDPGEIVQYAFDPGGDDELPINGYSWLLLVVASALGAGAYFKNTTKRQAL